MSKLCPKTCKTCKNLQKAKPSTQKITTITTTTTTTTTSFSPCYDKHEQCYKMKKYCNHKSHSKRVQEMCPETCEVCPQIDATKASSTTRTRLN